MPNNKKLEDVFDGASEWDLNIQELNNKSRITAWRVAFVALFFLGLSITSNVLMLPLKETFHHIIRVDSVTGMVDVIRSTKDTRISFDEKTDKYWLRLYVRERESYLYDTYQSQYENVSLLSSKDIQTQWYAYFNPRNPNSPTAIFSDAAKLTVKFRSITFIDKGVAQIRYTRYEERKKEGPKPTYWISTIKYRYVNTPASEDVLAVNPLGFQVTEYRNDPELGVTEDNQQVEK